MAHLEIKTDPAFESKMNIYSGQIKDAMQKLRKWVIETAEESPEITEIHETLKWGEPSFVTKYGSTLRMDYKEKTPEHYQLYFKCTSKLVPAFKAVYGGFFQYEKNRAIKLPLDKEIPVDQLKQCIKAALLYHKVKQKINLGLEEKFIA